jgi:hypothetical protein
MPFGLLLLISAERSAGTVFLFVPAERLHNLRE